MSAPSPLNASGALVAFTVKIRGEDLGSTAQVLSIQVDSAVNRIGAAQVTLVAGSESELSPGVAAPGDAIEILAGYDGASTSIFSGVVSRCALQEAAGRGGPLWVYGCEGRAAALTRTRSRGLLAGTSDAAAMRTLIERHGLVAAVADTAERTTPATQFAATDWDFLLTLAEANGCVVLATGNQITVRPPDLAAAPGLSLTCGVDVLDFRLDEESAAQFSAVTASSWDPATQSVISATQPPAPSAPAATAKPSGPALSLATAAALPAPALASWSAAQLVKSALARVRGTLKFQGSALAQLGGNVALAGFGARFDGSAYVGGVSHQIAEGNWQTTVSLGLPAGWHAAQPGVSAPRAAALTPAIGGLHIGTVKQIDADPSGQSRVLVALPLVAGEGAANGLWARLAGAYATNGAGAVYFPEIGDEVVLAFLDSDPRFPIILGSLYSSARPPAYPPEAKNATKGVVTRGQLKLLFDDEKKSVTIETPGGGSLVLSDDAKALTLADQNGNTVKLDASGIALSSRGDLILRAAQNVVIEAQNGNLTAKAGLGFSAAGLSVALNAQTTFSAQASAEAKLTSDGLLMIQGTLVKIN